MSRPIKNTLRRQRISNKHPHIKLLKHAREDEWNGSGRWACHGPWVWAYGESPYEAYCNFQRVRERMRSD